LLARGGCLLLYLPLRCSGIGLRLFLLRALLRALLWRMDLLALLRGFAGGLRLPVALRALDPPLLGRAIDGRRLPMRRNRALRRDTRRGGAVRRHVVRRHVRCGGSMRRDMWGHGALRCRVWRSALGRRRFGRRGNVGGRL
jgi:hypothetical protein